MKRRGSPSPTRSRALEREEATLDAVLRTKVKEALDDPSPAIPADQVFAELRARHAERANSIADDA